MPFPKLHTSTTNVALPAMKAPMAAPQEAPDPVAPPPASGMKLPKMKGATVAVKKPKPPSSRMREQNGM